METTFDEWWRTTGQFLPPLDALKQGFVLDHYKEFARQVYNSRNAEIEEAKNDAYDEGWEDGRIDLKRLK